MANGVDGDFFLDDGLHELLATFASRGLGLRHFFPPAATDFSVATWQIYCCVLTMMLKLSSSMNVDQVANVALEKVMKASFDGGGLVRACDESPPAAVEDESCGGQSPCRPC